MSASDVILLVVLGAGLVLFLAGIAAWQRRAFYGRDLRQRPDGPDPKAPHDVPFNDGDFIYRVTALPALAPVWLFRSDSGLDRPSPTGGDSLVGVILGQLAWAVALAVGRTKASSLDPRWRVVVDRKDQPNLAIFHAVSVEFFDSQADAERRRDQPWTLGRRAGAMRR
jgi:hypothetical protein